MALVRYPLTAVASALERAAEPRSSAVEAVPSAEAVARRATMCHMANEPRQHRSFRFSTDTLRRLDDRAHQIRETRTGLAERYVEEGLRMDEHPGIGFADGPAGRRAILLGTGLDVWEIVATVRQNRGSLVAASSYLDLPPSSVRAAIRYYAAFSDEVDDLLASQARAAEREQVAADRERLLLG